MNFQHFIQQAQSFANVKSSLVEKQVIVKEQENLALLTYPNVSQRSETYSPSMNDLLIRSCRGVIVQQEPLKVLAYTFSKPYSQTSFDNTNWSNFIVEELIDGSFIKLFYYEGTWNVSTHRCINSKKAMFNSYKSFFDMWVEAKDNSGLNYDDLNQNYTYSFVLCHPENRIVSNYTTSYIVHIGTFDVLDSKEVDVTIPNIRKPKQFDFSDCGELIEKLSLVGHETRGFMLKSKQLNDNGEYDRYVFESENYKKVKDIRGDNRSMIYRYIYLSRTDPILFQDFKTYFPEFSWIDTQFEQLSQLIHWLYLSYYVNKTTRFINPKYWQLTNELHTLYLRSMQPTTIHTVRNHLNSYPINELCSLLQGKITFVNRGDSNSNSTTSETQIGNIDTTTLTHQQTPDNTPPDNTVG